MSSSWTATAGANATAGHAWHKPNPHVKYVGYIHGVLMLLAFGILYPLGAVILRGFSGKRVLRLHAYWQILSLLISLVGFAMGIYIAYKGGYGVFKARNGHKIIGLVVIIMMILQPFLGTIHHLIFKKESRKTLYGYVHRNLGRIALIMGAVNVGLGLQLGRAELPRMIAYSCVTAFFFGAYFTVLLIHGPEAQKCKTLLSNTNKPSHNPSISTTDTTRINVEAEKNDDRV